MKIAHISDIHLSYRYKSHNFDKLIKILEYVSGNSFDHLVITGDITHTAQKYDFQSLKEILKTFGMYNNQKTTIIIGNHDIFGGVVTAEDVYNFPIKCKNTDYKKQVNNFFNHFSELYENCSFPDPENVYPFIKTVGDVAFFGLNSIAEYSYIKNPLASNGKLCKKDFTVLKTAVNSVEIKSKFKIAIIHHHFSRFKKDNVHLNNYFWNKIEKNTMKLRKKNKILKLFKTMDVKLVLHGHIHIYSDYLKSGIHFINAGNSIENGNEKELLINMIEIDKNKMTSNQVNPLEKRIFSHINY